MSTRGSSRVVKTIARPILEDETKRNRHFHNSPTTALPHSPTSTSTLPSSKSTSNHTISFPSSSSPSFQLSYPSTKSPGIFFAASSLLFSFSTGSATYPNFLPFSSASIAPQFHHSMPGDLSYGASSSRNCNVSPFEHSRDEMSTSRLIVYDSPELIDGSVAKPTLSCQSSSDGCLKLRRSAGLCSTRRFHELPPCE
jgi:hypothetical protein